MSDNEPTSLEQQWAARAEAEESEGAEPELAPDETEELRLEVAELKDQLLRRQAELINFRRRSERDRADRVDAARAEVVRQLLPVIDNLDRALGIGTDNLDAYREGVELILRSLHEALVRIGVEKLDPAGETFDPHLHEALTQVASEETPAGSIAEVYQPGYRFGARLLRAATVSVSTGGEEAPGVDRVSERGEEAPTEHGEHVPTEQGENAPQRGNAAPERCNTAPEQVDE